MTIEELNALADELLTRFDHLSVRGSEWSGSTRRGFSFSAAVLGPVEGGVEGQSGFIPPPPPLTGACCHRDGTCTQTTHLGCDGTYQGDGTLCSHVSCCNLSGAFFSIGAIGLVCCDGGGTTEFNISGSGFSGSGSNLGIDMSWSASISDNGDGTVTLSWTANLTDTNCTDSTTFTYSHSTTESCGGEHNDGFGGVSCIGCYDYNPDTDPPCDHCTSAYCGSPYGCCPNGLWLFNLSGFGLNVSWGI